MVIKNDYDIIEKLTILSDAAKYDAACTSSGVSRSSAGNGLGNAAACGICHSFAADGRCISLLKILMTNECIFDCKYCINRSSNDVVRTTFTPDEICRLTIEFYRRNYIEGLFLSSGIIQSPDHTMKLMFETAYLLRTRYHFNGYIHMKGIPGASNDIIDALGWYVDRMSVNLELPTSEGLSRLAPHKNRKSILTPMRHIQNGIAANNHGRYIDDHSSLNTPADVLSMMNSEHQHGNLLNASHSRSFHAPLKRNGSPVSYVPAGQSTQMIIGATPETDYQLVSVAEALYKNYNLKRVFYSAFINVNHDSQLPDTSGAGKVSLLREHRLYQADWLMRFYGFQAGELLSESKPNFNTLIDPKCDWALRHLWLFPVEVNLADYSTLLRIPGIGVKSASRIVKARRMAKLDFTDLKKMGVVLKRSVYFITCSGKMMYPITISEDYITNALISDEQRNRYQIEHHDSYRQLSLFDDYKAAPIHI